MEKSSFNGHEAVRETMRFQYRSSGAISRDHLNSAIMWRNTQKRATGPSAMPPSMQDELTALVMSITAQHQGASIEALASRASNLTTDAQFAVIAFEHGATLGTFDRDFERFSGLRLEPLSAHAVHEP